MIQIPAWPAIVAAWVCLAPLAAEARGRGPQAAETTTAPLEIHPPLVAEAERHLGQGNFTGRPGPWCAWAISACLKAIGLPPLASGMASSALAYGPRTSSPRPGDLAVMRGHVGIVVADRGAKIEIISGNWGGRVRLAEIDRRAVRAFVRS